MCVCVGYLTVCSSSWREAPNERTNGGIVKAVGLAWAGASDPATGPAAAETLRSILAFAPANLTRTMFTTCPPYAQVGCCCPAGEGNHMNSVQITENWWCGLYGEKKKFKRDLAKYGWKQQMEVYTSKVDDLCEKSEGCLEYDIFCVWKLESSLWIS